MEGARKDGGWEGGSKGRVGGEGGSKGGSDDAMQRAEEGLSEEGREQWSKGGRETSREVVYSQTNHSQTGPCP